jgi:hypothetical protein
MYSGLLGPYPSKALSGLDQILPSFHQHHHGCIVQYITLCPLDRSPSRLCRFTLARFLSAAVSMARRKGSVNYENKVLIKIIGKILPNGEYGWQAVAIAYQSQVKKEALRDSNDLKKHWNRNLCNNMKKPTGRMGENGDQTHRCMAIKKRIMDKTHLGMLGFSSEDNDRIQPVEGDDEDSEDEGEGGEKYLFGDDAGDITANLFPANGTEQQQATTAGNDNEQATAAAGNDDEGQMEK